MYVNILAFRDTNGRTQDVNAFIVITFDLSPFLGLRCQIWNIVPIVNCTIVHQTREWHPWYLNLSVQTGIWSWTTCCSTRKASWRLRTLAYARRGWATATGRGRSVVLQSSSLQRSSLSLRTPAPSTGGASGCSYSRCLWERWVLRVLIFEMLMGEVDSTFRP